MNSARKYNEDILLGFMV